jgi:hypothetical protein
MSTGNQSKRETKAGNPNWTKGGPSPNPGGRRALPPELRDALLSDTLPRYRRLQALAKKAEKKGDLKTAAHIELALLKKTIPDATELVVSMPEGLEVRDRRIDPKKLSTEELRTLVALTAKASAKEGA